MALERVRTECVNATIATVGMMVGRGARSIQGPDRDTIGAAKEFSITTLGKGGLEAIAMAGLRACLA